MNNSKITVLALSILLVISSCSVIKKDGIRQSRTYKHKTTSIWNKKSKDKTIDENNRLALAEKAGVEIKASSVNADRLLVNEIKLPRRVDKLLQKPSDYQATFLNPTADSCDNIVLRNGDEISGIVVEISTTELKYKRCIQPDGPTIIINKDDVLFVKYKDGKKEVFNKTSSKPAVTEQTSSKEEKPAGSGALKGIGIVLLVIGIIMFLVVSILLGLIVAGLGLLFIVSAKK